MAQRDDLTDARPLKGTSSPQSARNACATALNPNSPPVRAEAGGRAEWGFLQLS